jgi:hypothetical protein
MPEQKFDKLITPETLPQQASEKEQIEGETDIEKELKSLENEISASEKLSQSVNTSLPNTANTPVKTAVIKTATRKSIEGILSEDMKELFQNMDAAHKAEFKKQAEETASALEILIATAKATARKVVKLISNWLKLIPGINQFFLEQEAKIKTDTLMELVKKK